MEKLKIGIIGCGGIANGKHMSSIKQLDNVEMVAFCDIIPERAEKAAKEYGTADAKVYTDYKELLKDESINNVRVLTQNNMHARISIDAMKAGKHVMCEKPMAMNYAEAKEMIKVSKETGKLLTIGYQHTFDPDVIYAKAESEKGTFGDMYFAKANVVRRRGVPTWGVFLNEYEQGGGPLIDIGTHALDLTLWMMDNYKPKMVVGTTFEKLKNQKDCGNAWGDWDPEKFTVEDAAFGFIVMENGATIVLESSWALNSLDTREAVTSFCGTLGGADMIDGLRINGVKHNTQYVEKPDFSVGGVAFNDGVAGE